MKPTSFVRPSFLALTALLLAACTVSLRDTTGTFAFNDPNNLQTFRAETDSTRVLDVEVEVQNGPTAPLAQSVNEWSATVQFPRCASPVFYTYRVRYRAGLLTRTKTFPEAGVFSRGITNRPDDCANVPVTGGRTFVVDSTADLPDASPGDGQCVAASDGGEVCTLRAAVMEANASPGTDRIELSKARHVLSRTLPSGSEAEGSPNDAFGDLDITDSVVITAPRSGGDDLGSVLRTEVSAGQTTLKNLDADDESLDRTDADALFARVDGGGIDRVFQVHAIRGGEGFAVFENFAIVNGAVFDRGGAGIRNDGALRLDHVVVAENRAHPAGGPGGVFSANRGAGIVNYGFLQASDLAVVRNKVTEETGFAGGLFNQNGATALIERSLFAFNEARFASAIYNDQNEDLPPPGADLTLVNATITGNRVTGSVRGALINQGTASLHFVTVVENASITGVVSSSGAITRLGNTALADNGQRDCAGGFVSLGFNTVSDATGCALMLGTAPNPQDLLNAPALFGVLGDNGGFLYTLRPLANASSAANVVDRGQGLFAQPPTDARGPGFLRSVGGSPDVGAVEVN
ncbi:MAG: choice-of-anchor Q domain-containing protein [Myxococcota bacterium]